MSTKPFIFASELLKLVGGGIYLGEWVTGSQYPVDLALYRGRRDPGGAPKDHPVLYFRPRPVPILDDRSLVAAFGQASRPAPDRKVAAYGGLGSTVPQVGWAPAFQGRTDAASWLHPERAWTQTRDAARVFVALGQDGGGQLPVDRRQLIPKSLLGTSFMSRNERSRLKRWAANGTGPGESDGPAFGPMAQALYATQKEYGKVLFDPDKGEPMESALRRWVTVVQGLAKDAPWLLATEHFAPLLQHVLLCLRVPGVGTGPAEWPQLMDVLASSAAYKLRGRRNMHHDEPLRTAALTQLEEHGYPVLEVARWLAGSSEMLSWSDKGPHKARVRWLKGAASRGAWTAVFPFWNERLPVAPSNGPDEPLRNWLRTIGPPALSRLLLTRVGGHSLRPGAPLGGRLTSGLRGVLDPSSWTFVAHQEPGAEWIYERVAAAGADSISAQTRTNTTNPEASPKE